MSEILKDFSAPTLVAALEANLWEALAYWGQSPQIELHDYADMMWYVTGVAHPMLNGAFRTQLAPGDIDVRIEATLNYFKSRKVPMTWWTGPATRPVDLGEHLEAHGLTHAGDPAGMAVDLLALNEDLPIPSDLTIERVGDVETLKEWLQAFATGFKFPDFAANAFFDIYAGLGFGQHLPWHHYAGRLKGEPVACSSVFLSAGVAGIYNVATVPHARGQGI
ncbi:unnamed protein product, partial [marine sediment metagenome]